MPFRKKVYTVGRLAHDIAVLAGRLDEVVGIQTGATLDPAFREEVMVAVARENACRYCIFAHETAAREVGVSDAALGDIADPAVPRTTIAPTRALALDYARALAADDFGPVDPVLESEVVAVFGDDFRRTLETTARLMTVANLTGNTVDALVSRLRGEAAPGSRPCDELAIASLWAAGAAAASVNLMLARGESPPALLAAFRRFAGDLEAEPA